MNSMYRQLAIVALYIALVYSYQGVDIQIDGDTQLALIGHCKEYMKCDGKDIPLGGKVNCNGTLDGSGQLDNWSEIRGSSLLFHNCWDDYTLTASQAVFGGKLQFNNPNGNVHFHVYDGTNYVSGPVEFSGSDVYFENVITSNTTIKSVHGQPGNFTLRGFSVQLNANGPFYTASDSVTTLSTGSGAGFATFTVTSNANFGDVVIRAGTNVYVNTRGGADSQVNVHGSMTLDCDRELDISLGNLCVEKVLSFKGKHDVKIRQEKGAVVQVGALECNSTPNCDKLDWIKVVKGLQCGQMSHEHSF